MSFRINPLGESQNYGIGQAKPNAKTGVDQLFPNLRKKELTPEQRKNNEQTALKQLKRDGYKLTPDGEGRYIIEDKLGHKSKITSLGLDEKGNATYLELQVQIIDPSQKARFERIVLNNEKESPEDKAKYAKQAMQKARNAGYTITQQEHGRYILTDPTGHRSLVTNFNIDWDGGATWTVLPIDLGGNKPNFTLEKY